MAKHSMICHPDTPANAVEAFEVDIEWRADGSLCLRYHVECPVDDLELGSAKEPKRADGLWRTTCFEAFLRAVNDEGYLEFNFAPSGEWAAYRFDCYRCGMEELSVPFTPQTATDANDMHFALEAVVPLPRDLGSSELQVAITAVIEEADGTKSYWSLVHPEGPPDFHHPDCFALTLPAPASI